MGVLVHGGDRPGGDPGRGLARINGIESAFLSGSFARSDARGAGPAPYDIDIMVLGDPDVDAAMRRAPESRPRCTVP
ncbi:MAG: hypothetical protein AVDCRST_MAG24-1099 [uncultured Nocardioidaceae bacterium]|uniref:Uncharacterized protein n=1 Tax=uncultured Nocardioidaceae bacterium TaxID=253824 RepID=A0A6J4LN24_9ACTN|nr:MAG: hypothetical protein AVDCRST_MAG24-1099 [uncultured Nocardioidaceae bacterium]